MKFIFSIFIGLIFTSHANAQKAYDCDGQQAYDLAKDVVIRTVEGASNVVAVDEGVEQTTIKNTKGVETNFEEWNVSVNYDKDGVTGKTQSFRITYVVSIEPTTLVGICRFESIIQTWVD